MAGLKSGSASKLLKLAAPLLLNVIGKKVKSGGLNLKSFTDLLMGQKDHLATAAPKGLFDKLGGVMDLGALGSAVSGFAGDVKDKASDAAASAEDAIEDTAKSGGNLFRKLFPWLLLLLAILLLLYFLRSCNDGKDNVAKATDDIEEVAADAADVVENTAGEIYNAGEELVGKMVKGF